MGEDRAVWEHRVFTRLTAIKLANQILERQPGLSAYQCRLIRIAIQAADGLVADLLERHQAGREQPVMREPLGRPRLSGRDQSARQRTPGSVRES